MQIFFSGHAFIWLCDNQYVWQIVFTELKTETRIKVSEKACDHYFNYIFWDANIYVCPRRVGMRCLLRYSRHKNKFYSSVLSFVLFRCRHLNWIIYSSCFRFSNKLSCRRFFLKSAKQKQCRIWKMIPAWITTIYT